MFTLQFFFLVKLHSASQECAFLVTTFLVGVISQSLAYVSTQLLRETLWKFEILYELAIKLKDLAQTMSPRSKSKSHHSKNWDRPNVRRIKSQIRMEALAVFWLLFGMLIIS